MTVPAKNREKPRCPDIAQYFHKILFHTKIETIFMWAIDQGIILKNK